MVLVKLLKSVNIVMVWWKFVWKIWVNMVNVGWYSVVFMVSLIIV